MPKRRFRRSYRPSKIRRLRRKLRRKGKGQTGIRYFKLKYTSGVTSDAGGTISAFSVANPTSAWSGGGTVNDWTSVSSLFDSFRTCAMKWQFVPQFPNDTSVTTGFFPLYVGFDVDSNGTPIGSIADALQYENVRIKNMYRPWKFYTKVPKTAASKQQGWCDIATPADCFGSIWGYGNGFDVSQTYGQMIITYYIKCKDRR